MICTIYFRDVYKREFTNGPYTYKCDLNVKPGDLVLVNTKYGVSLAQVSKINLKLLTDNIDKLEYVLEKCVTQYEQDKS